MSVADYAAVFYGNGRAPLLGGQKFWDGRAEIVGVPTFASLPMFFCEGDANGVSLQAAERFIDGVAPVGSEEAPTGEYSFVLIDENEAVFATDPVGLCYLLVLQTADYVLVANGHEPLDAAARQLGLALTPDPNALADLFCIGSPLAPSSGYAEVELVPLHQYVKLERDGLLRLLDRSFWRFIADARAGKHSYEALLSGAVGQIRSAAIAVGETPHQYKVQEITGGRDSRVVLAALLGVKDLSFAGYCRGKLTDPDQIIASLLRTTFGIRRASSPYTYEVSASEAVQLAKAKNGLVRQMDDVSYYCDSPLPDRLVIGGASGETFRGFFAPMIVGSRPEIKNSLPGAVDAFTRKYKYWSLWSSNYARARVEQATNFASSFAVEDPLLAVDLLYIYSRNRFHAGLATRARRRLFAQANPANSFLALAASYVLPGELRARGKVAFDLMLALYPPLAFFPITGGAWHPSVASGAAYAGALEKMTMPLAVRSEPEELKLPAPTARQKRVHQDEELRSILKGGLIGLIEDDEIARRLDTGRLPGLADTDPRLVHRLTAPVSYYLELKRNRR
ncbi:hypothetical protein [Methylosinus sp. Sm6]|uniref:hypothetical protein n=1 Tax=Methylosinus sp. Sm6 TaxID=2866948 RepID=UPI001C9965B8|nr:hypothetical protein [Methylosinus sp. Sm6]